MNTVNVVLIKTKADYAAAKARIRDLMENGGNPDEITAQARFIQEYEQRNFPIPDPDPIDALLFRMEQEGMDRNGLAALLHASSGRVSEILSRRRPLSIAMIRAIHEKFGISGDILIRSPRRSNPPTRTRASRSIAHPV